MENLFSKTAATVFLVASTGLATTANGQPVTSLQSKTVTATGIAYGGHSEVEALKEEVAALKSSLEKTEFSREYMKKRLTEVLAEGKESDKANEALQAEKKDLLKSLRFMTDSRDYLFDEMETQTQQLQQTEADAEVALQRAMSGRNFLSQQLKAQRAETARLASELTAAKQQSDAEIQQIADVSFEQINSAIAERDAAQAKVGELEDEIAQIADVSFEQINSAIAERDAANDKLTSTEWADTLSSVLSDELASLNGTEVSALSNNSVSVKVGNTGLFRPGGINLSSDGADLLSDIGTRIAGHDDASIKIIGHTDNIPVGEGSRFASNNELSMARANSALAHMVSIGVPAERLSASGFGETYPIASNDTEEGRLANRRVEIVLTQTR